MAIWIPTAEWASPLLSAPEAPPTTPVLEALWQAISYTCRGITEAGTSFLAPFESLPSNLIWTLGVGAGVVYVLGTWTGRCCSSRCADGGAAQCEACRACASFISTSTLPPRGVRTPSHTTPLSGAVAAGLFNLSSLALGEDRLNWGDRDISGNGQGERQVVLHEDGGSRARDLSLAFPPRMRVDRVLGDYAPREPAPQAKNGCFKAGLA